VRQSAVWNTESPRQSEVGELDASVDVDQEILWLEVAMDHTVTVAVGDAAQQLVQIALLTVGQSVCYRFVGPVAST